MLCFNTTLSEAVPSIIMTVILSKAAAASAAERLQENCCQHPAASRTSSCGASNFGCSKRSAESLIGSKTEQGGVCCSASSHGDVIGSSAFHTGQRCRALVVFCTRVFIGSSVSHISLKGGTTYREQCFPEFYTFIYLFILPPFLSVIAVHPSGNVFSPFSSTSGGYGMFKRVKCVAQKQNLWCWRFLCLIHAP